ncbi:hypothetical protein [Microcoleus sp. POL10_C6]|uniref:hypothetical protein n=1 Tax=Microcoleus sp. POL10_C6 TaxID=2818852 RepID=UPI002FD3A933
MSKVLRLTHIFLPQAYCQKLGPVVACHPVILEQFLKDFWDYYRELLAYKDCPSAEAARELKSKFWQLFDTLSGYELLYQRKQLTAAKAFLVASGF